jgi:hypothetical protein
MWGGVLYSTLDSIMLKPILAGLALLAAGATASAAQPTPLSLRDALQGVSPIAYETVLHLEASHHTRYTDEQLNSLFTSPEFAAEYEHTHVEFCAKSENQNVLACQPGQGANAAAHRH